MIIKKKNLPKMDLGVPEDQRVKIKESEKIDKYFDLAREKKAVEHESDGDTKCY